jgi:LPS-assembly lipoprotein
MGGAWQSARFLPVLASFAVTACGFQLRGDVHYPPGMQTTYIEAEDHYSPFYAELRSALLESGLRLADAPIGAGATVHVLKDETGQRILSVSARNTPVEYEIYYVIRYSLEMGGQESIPPQRLALTREYTWDETAVLGKSEEADTLRRALAQDLVALVSRRLATAQ